MALILVLAWALCLFHFFLLGGFEVAYTELRDKDPSQLDQSLRERFLDMQRKEPRIYEGKEWITVLLTVGLALIAEWHTEVHLNRILGQGAEARTTQVMSGVTTERKTTPANCPPQGDSLSDPNVVTARLGFVLLFTTVPILLLSLGPAKQLALKNSERYIQKWSPYLWPVLRSLGRCIIELRLPVPSEMIVRAVGQTPKRNLKPSFGAYYMMSLQRFRHSTHRISERITISPDGSAEIALQVEAFILHPFETGKLEGGIYNPSGVEERGFEPLWAVRTELPLEVHSEFDNQVIQLASNNQGVDLASKIKCRFRKDNDVDGKLNYEISLPSADPTDEFHSFALSYRVKFKTGREGFVGKNEGARHLRPQDDKDWYSRSFDWPCYSYRLILEFADKSHQVGFNRPVARVTYAHAPHEQETTRINDLIRGMGGDSKLEIDVPYPLPGAEYKFHWEVW